MWFSYARLFYLSFSAIQLKGWQRIPESKQYGINWLLCPNFASIFVVFRSTPPFEFLSFLAFNWHCAFNPVIVRETSSYGNGGEKLENLGFSVFKVRPEALTIQSSQQFHKNKVNMHRLY